MKSPALLASGTERRFTHVTQRAGSVLKEASGFSGVQPGVDLSLHDRALGCGRLNAHMFEPNVQQTVPLLNVANLQESLRFYVDGLGFEVKRKWESDGRLYWCWLQHGGASLMLQQPPTDGPDSWKPGGVVGEGISICFQCQDAIAIHRQMLNRNFEASK